MWRAPVFGVCAFPLCHLSCGQGHGSKAASCHCHPHLVKGSPRPGQDPLPLGGPAGFQWTFFFITSGSNCRLIVPFLGQDLSPVFGLKEFRAPPHPQHWAEVGAVLRARRA